jgi:predicted small secreted protein
MFHVTRGLALIAALALPTGLASCNTMSAETGEAIPSAAQENANATDLNAPNSVQPGHAGTSPDGTGNTAPRSSGSNASPGPSPVPTPVPH